ncbi:MAG: site-2 protease family protein [Candidatus Helarchaeota archaeon]|nr:site-2 protease family protein [Candidatus Helarchaeota archaeon]
MGKFSEFINRIWNGKNYEKKGIDISIPKENERIFTESEEKKRIPYINIILLLITIFTTLVAGALIEGANIISDFSSLKIGIPFSFTLISILGFHELGHFVVSRLHGVKATLPYFIPAPPPFFFIGTFGAFIKVKSPIYDKKTLLDIGAAGPIAGFLIAVPSIIWGLQISEVKEVLPGQGLKLGNSLLLYIAEKIIYGDIPPGYDIHLGSVAFAGFIGLLVTAFNLMPIGQLDGGHIAYALFGNKQRIIAKIFFLSLFVLGFVCWLGWLVWAFLVYAIGFRHPPTAYDFIDIDKKRKIIGYICVGIFILCFTPIPFSF